MHVRRFLLLSSATWILTGAFALAAEEGQAAPRPAAELEELFAPIALYPDALVALILPAATMPSDVVLAARHLAATPGPVSFENEAWDDSVLGLAYYPEVLKWMDENLAWTKAAGEAFKEQPAEVMNTIQRLRSRAQVAGTLTTTPQQRVVVESDHILIVPARADVIHVPRYDPAVVFVERRVHYPRPYLTFGIGYGVGHWLAYDCDWRRRTVLVVHRPHRATYWRQTRDWRDRYRSGSYHRHLGNHNRWHVWHSGSRSRDSRWTPHSTLRRGSWAGPGTRAPSHLHQSHGSSRSTWSRHGSDSRFGERSGRPWDGRRELRQSALPSGPTPSMAAPVTRIPDMRSTLRPQPSSPFARTPSGRFHRDHRSTGHRDHAISRRSHERSGSGRFTPPSGHERRTVAVPGFSRERRSSDGRGARTSESRTRSSRQWGHSQRSGHGGDHGSRHEHGRRAPRH